jgi:hypothetical protein
MNKKLTIIIIASLLILNIAQSEEFRGGLMTISGEQDISSTISSKLKGGTIKAYNIDITSKGLGQDVTLKTKSADSYIEFNGNKYINLKEGSTITTDRNGKIKMAELTLTKDTSLKLPLLTQSDIKPKEKENKVEKGARVTCDSGAIELYGKGKSLEIKNEKGSDKIRADSEKIRINNGKITGDEFTIDPLSENSKEFKAVGNGSAEVTLMKLTDNTIGLVVGKNTKGDFGDKTITSQGGDVAVPSEQCGSLKGYVTSVSSCKGKIEMNSVSGDGFDVTLKPGMYPIVKNGGYITYALNGGAVSLDYTSGKETIEVDEKIAKGKSESVTQTNGNSVIKYEKKDGNMYITQMIKDVTPTKDYNLVINKPNVDLATQFGDMVTIESSDTGATKLYSCHGKASATGMAVTGAASFSDIIDTCKELVGWNTKKANAYVGTKWGEDVITNYGDYIMKADPMLTEGKELYFRVVTTKNLKGGTDEYRIYNDGSIEKLDKTKNMYIKTNDLVPAGSFGLSKEEIQKNVASLSPSPKTSQPQTQKKENDAVTAYQNLGEKVWNDQIKGQEQGVYYLPPSAPADSYVHLVPKQGSMIRNSDFLVEPVKDKTGKVVKYVGVSSGMEFVPIGNGKVKQVK